MSSVDTSILLNHPAVAAVLAYSIGHGSGSFSEHQREYDQQSDNCNREKNVKNGGPDTCRKFFVYHLIGDIGSSASVTCTPFNRIAAGALCLRRIV